MNTDIQITTKDRELILTKIIQAPREKVYRAWTEPELLKQWFAPLPYTVPHAEMDVRTGGSSLIVMKGPDGDEIPCTGIYLEVVPNERLVTTDAYTKTWEPSGKPFMTLILTLEDQNGNTKYTAHVLHWSSEDREAHEKMGFREGWSLCTKQLEALASKL